MPGSISDQHKGTPDHAPYIPSWCYPDNEPKHCPCGHHEGYHDDAGACLHKRTCGCIGLPETARTTAAEKAAYNRSVDTLAKLSMGRNPASIR